MVSSIQSAVRSSVRVAIRMIPILVVMGVTSGVYASVSYLLDRLNEKYSANSELRADSSAEGKPFPDSKIIARPSVPDDSGLVMKFIEDAQREGIFALDLKLTEAVPQTPSSPEPSSPNPNDPWGMPQQPAPLPKPLGLTDTHNPLGMPPSRRRGSGTC